MKTKDERRRTKVGRKIWTTDDGRQTTEQPIYTRLLLLIAHVLSPQPSALSLSLSCLLLLAACGAAPPPTPTATPVIAPAPSSAPTALGAVPDLRGKTPVEAAELLTPLDLRLGMESSSCSEIGATPIDPAGPDGSILCQSIPPGSMAPAGVAIDYVLNHPR